MGGGCRGETSCAFLKRDRAEELDKCKRQPKRADTINKRRATGTSRGSRRPDGQTAKPAQRWRTRQAPLVDSPASQDEVLCSASSVWCRCPTVVILGHSCGRPITKASSVPPLASSLTEQGLCSRHRLLPEPTALLVVLDHVARAAGAVLGTLHQGTEILPGSRAARESHALDARLS